MIPQRRNTNEPVEVPCSHSTQSSSTPSGRLLAPTCPNKGYAPTRSGVTGRGSLTATASRPSCSAWSPGAAGTWPGTSAKRSETTLRRRRDEWVAAGAFAHLVEEAICAFDKMIGLDFSDVSIDGSLHKAPAGGEGTGPNPTDRGKTGWKWSLATDTNGVPIGWVIDGANRNDSILLAPTLDDIARRGLLGDVETIWLDRGYDSEVTRTRLVERGIDDAVIAKRRRRGSAEGPKHQPMGLRWPVERTNSWLSNFGQLRRNTDRFNTHRLAQFASAVALIITVKLVKWAKRWDSMAAA